MCAIESSFKKDLVALGAPPPQSSLPPITTALVGDNQQVYPEMGRALLATGRDMVYSCEWPFYQIISGILPDYKNVSKNCNLWRNYFDINYTWEGITNITNFEASIQDIAASVSGPGAWTDPDMHVIGNFGLTIELQRAHMAYWAVMAAPLIMSNDLRHIAQESRDLLLNKYIIAINQDPLGFMGKRIHKLAKNLDIWTRWETPELADGRRSLAVLVYNTKNLGGPVQTSITLQSLNLGHKASTSPLPPMDVFFFKATALSGLHDAVF
ncbi:hypothetical protein MRX96_023334 [Rhipicephalus microplus]